MEDAKDNQVTILIERDSSCGENCTMCKTCPGKNLRITVYTETPLAKGDYVKLETNTKYVLLSAFIVYLLPIILLIAGYAVFTLYIGILFMTISFIFLFFIDKKINTKHLIKVSKVH